MPGLSSASEFWVGSWRFRCRVKDHILQISIMQGQIKSMQVLIDSNQLCLTCPVDILTKTTVDWGMTSLMPEMKIPCVEAASSFHGITLPPSMENSPVLTHRGLLSRFCLMQQSVTLPSKTLCCLIVQRPDKGLVKSRTHRTHSRSHQDQRWLFRQPQLLWHEEPIWGRRVCAVPGLPCFLLRLPYEPLSLRDTALSFQGHALNLFS